MRYALGAGDLFDVSAKNEYVETLIGRWTRTCRQCSNANQLDAFAAKCIDEYIALRIREEEKSVAAVSTVDPRLESIVNRMFDRCFDEGEFKQALGVALEARRLDVLSKAINNSGEIGRAHV